MGGARLCFYFLGGWLLDIGDIEYLAIFLETIFDAVMTALVLQQFIHKILDDRGECLVIIFPVSVNRDLFMLEGGLIAIKRYFLNIFREIGEIVIAIDLKELDYLFFL